jgi:hypothetical protein
VVLTGPPGVGKSELEREYARQSADLYAGGAFVVNCDNEGPPIDLAHIGASNLRLAMSDLSLENQCLKALYSLGDEPTLLILDNVPATGTIEKWLPRSGQSCHALVTTNVSGWGTGFDEFEIKPLDSDQSVELTRKIGAQIPDRFAAALAEWSGGLPQQIIPQAAALAKDATRGRLDSTSVHMPLSPDLASYRRVYNQLETPARLLLHAATVFRPHRVPQEDLCRTVIDVIGGDVSSAHRWLDACQDRFLLTGQSELNMHQLLRNFVAGEQLDQQLSGPLAKVRRLQWRRFLDLAKTVSDDPVNAISAQR